MGICYTVGVSPQSRGVSPVLKPVAIVGFGRFGRALCELFLDAGYCVRVFDPNITPPPELAVETIVEAVARAEIVIVSVPVPAFESVIQQLRPSLRSGQLVIDVCSVKFEPSQAMQTYVPEGVAWVASHPLFGPSSLARGERPLRVIVCPNEQHRGAVDEVKSLYEVIGCEVLLQTADEHDRVMAQTHALAFFLAKGLLDMRVGEDVAFVPPSFQSIARTIEAVREDAGHLFVAIHRQNPHARATRRQLLDALHNIDEHLAGVTPGLEPASDPVLQIPELTYQTPELLETRELIDAVDRELIRVFARRQQLVRRAGRVKAARGWGVRDPGREQRLMSERRAWAAEAGLVPDDVEELFLLLLSHSRTTQRGDGESR